MAVKLKRVKMSQDQINKKVAEIVDQKIEEAKIKVAKQFEKAAPKLIRSAILSFYTSYDPLYYERTWNFWQIQSEGNVDVQLNGTQIRIRVYLSIMNDYKRGAKTISHNYVAQSAFNSGFHGPEFLGIQIQPSPKEIYVKEASKFIKEATISYFKSGN